MDLFMSIGNVKVCGMVCLGFYYFQYILQEFTRSTKTVVIPIQHGYIKVNEESMKYQWLTKPFLILDKCITAYYKITFSGLYAYQLFTINLLKQALNPFSFSLYQYAILVAANYRMYLGTPSNFQFILCFSLLFRFCGVSSICCFLMHQVLPRFTAYTCNVTRQFSADIVLYNINFVPRVYGSFLVGNFT